MTFEEKWENLFGEKMIHNKITVYNQEDFEEASSTFEIGKVAIIEIYSGPNGKPILSKGIIEKNPETIIALDFEDFPENVRFPGGYQPTNPTITYEDCERLVKFIERNAKAHRDFIIHCGAGVSRSQQVAAYILMTNLYSYEYDKEKSTHTHHFSQTIVLSRLLETRHKLIPMFNNIDNAFEYCEEKKEWVMKKT